MPRTITSIFLCLAFFALTWTVPQMVQAQSPQETLDRFVTELQKSPNDHVLREKIIRHVRGMTPAPAIPEDAERFTARGAAAAKGTKTGKDYLEAASEFEKASLAAPWHPAVYYNLGVIQNKVDRHKEAIENLKLYLLAAPPELPMPRLSRR